MKSLPIRLMSLIASASALALLGVAGPSNALAAGNADPCTFGSSSGNTETCFSIDHSGTHINSATVSATVFNAPRFLKVCINGPARELPICFPSPGYISVSPGQTLELIWRPDRTVAAGSYCGRTRRLNSDGSDTVIGKVCISIG